MRAFEISVFLIMVLTAPSVLYAMGVVTVDNTCTTIDCQARVTIYSMANSFQLQAVDLNSGVAQIAWDVITLTVTFPIYAIFWMLYFLSIIVLIGPALQSMFHVPAVIATWFNVGVWILWLVAYIQWKGSKGSIDALR